jgi:hypothetical protein
MSSFSRRACNCARSPPMSCAAPCTIPVVARGVRQQAVDAFDERRRRSIVGDRFERSPKPAAGIFPVARPIGGEPFGIRSPKQYLRGALMVPPLPAASRPSNTMMIRAPVCLTQSCKWQSSTCSLRNSFSEALRFIFGLAMSAARFSAMVSSTSCKREGSAA